MVTEKKTLIVGGTGKTGRRVAERLTGRGVPIRIGSRSAEPPFDWDNPETWEESLKNVGSAYVTYYPDLAFSGAANTIRSFSKLAFESGVRRLVLLSGRGEEGALLGEQAVQESGAEWTIVRASFFNQNFSEGFLVESVVGGELVFPAGDVKEPFIDVDDIAEVVVAALLDDLHTGQVYEVTGPRLLTFSDAVGEIAKASRRQIRYVPVSLDDYKSALVSQGVPPHFAMQWITLLTSVLDGRNSSVTDGVRRALGREPKDFADYARETAAVGVWAQASASK